MSTRTSTATTATTAFTATTTLPTTTPMIPSATTDSAAKKDVTKLQRAIIDGLEDVKAQDIQVFNTEHLSPLFERVIVATGSSNRQTKALAASVRDAVREAGFSKPRTEGEENGEWIIVDCGQAVVHVMQPAIRQYYRLEEIWGDKPVRVKLGSTKARVAQASTTPATSATSKATAKKTATKKLSAQPKADKPKADRPKTQKVKTDKPTTPVKAVKAVKAATPAKDKPVAKKPRKAPTTPMQTIVVNKPAPKTAKKTDAKKSDPKSGTKAKATAKTAVKKPAVKKAAAPQG